MFHKTSVDGAIIVHASDTDILVLAVHYFPKLTNVSQLWIETGVITRTTDLRRFVPVHDIVAAIPKVLCDILPSVHALTGCDSTSAFFNIGKKSVYKLVRNNANRYKDLTKLGELSEGDSISPSRNLIAHLYDGKRNEALSKDLNKLRVHLATTKHTELSKNSSM